MSTEATTTPPPAIIISTPQAPRRNTQAAPLPRAQLDRIRTQLFRPSISEEQATPAPEVSPAEDDSFYTEQFGDETGLSPRYRRRI